MVFIPKEILKEKEKSGACPACASVRTRWARLSMEKKRFCNNCDYQWNPEHEWLGKEKPEYKEQHRMIEPSNTPLKRYDLACPACTEDCVQFPANEPETPYCTECDCEIDLNCVEEFVKAWSEYLADRAALLASDPPREEVEGENGLDFAGESEGGTESEE